MMCVKALYKLQQQLDEQSPPSCSRGHTPLAPFHHFLLLHTLRLGFLKVTSASVSNSPSDLQHGENALLWRTRGLFAVPILFATY